jgi:hypothetical protein
MTTRLEKDHGRGRLRRFVRHREAGMTTAEYAVGTLAACAFAAVLMAVIKSGGISGLITDVITTALSALL